MWSWLHRKCNNNRRDITKEARQFHPPYINTFFLPLRIIKLFVCILATINYMSINFCINQYFLYEYNICILVAVRTMALTFTWLNHGFTSTRSVVLVAYKVKTYPVRYHTRSWRYAISFYSSFFIIFKNDFRFSSAVYPSPLDPCLTKQHKTILATWIKYLLSWLRRKFIHN